MIDLRPALRRLPVLPLALVGLLVLAGCATAVGESPGEAAQAPTTEPSAASGAPSAAPSGAPASAGALDPAVPTACLTLDAADCAQARDMAATVLEAGDAPITYVQVGPFGCLAGDRCPATLAARPEGDVTLESAGGQGLTVHLRVAADGTFEATRQPAMGVAVQPASPVGFPAGPQPFTLGHCGIYSGIDADGSYWDPVGPVDTDSGDSINATEGVLTLTDPTHGTFVAPSGFAVQLQRHDGAKLLPMCM